MKICRGPRARALLLASCLIVVPLSPLPAMAQDFVSAPVDPVALAFRQAVARLKAPPPGVARATLLRQSVQPALEERASSLRAQRDAHLASWGTHDSHGHDVAGGAHESGPEETVLSGEGIPSYIEFKKRAK
jgi:hypothetical protein